MSPSSPDPADPSSAVARRFAAVRAEIAAACEAARRDAASVTLTAVTKTQPPAAIEDALACGQRVFGENRVQEAMGRWDGRRARTPDLELRLIGPLQTNKAMDALRLFDVVETLDRERLAEALSAAGHRLGVAPRVLVQVNTGAEPQKHGATAADVEGLIRRARELGLIVEGLMCIPPVSDAPAPHFALLRDLAARCGLATLSMGMSGDFAAAIAHGATHVRIGSALFGERNRPEMPSIG